MGQIVPDAVERYLSSLNGVHDALLEDVAREGARFDLPLIDAEVGALLRVLVTAAGATRVLEIGTAIGYSGLWMAGGLPPGGTLITMERDPERARAARDLFARAGLAEQVSVVVGDAQRLVAKVAGPFDLIFQDGDKAQYLPMLDRLVELLAPGGVLATDNVLWDGEVVPGFVDPPRREPADTAAIAAYNERLSNDPRLVTTFLPVGDGVAVGVKRVQ
jgi:predicted O-methyltransferase YrrM